MDIAVICFIDLATASNNVERAVTDIDCCRRHRKACEENKSACKFMAISFLAFFSHASRFLSGTEALPLLDRSNREEPASNGGTLSVDKNWFGLL